MVPHTLGVPRSSDLVVHPVGGISLIISPNIWKGNGKGGSATYVFKARGRFKYREETFSNISCPLNPVWLGVTSSVHPSMISSALLYPGAWRRLLSAIVTFLMSLLKWILVNLCPYWYVFPNPQWVWWNWCLGGFGESSRGGTWYCVQWHCSQSWTLSLWVHTHSWWWLRYMHGCLCSILVHFDTLGGLYLCPGTQDWSIWCGWNVWCCGLPCPWGLCCLPWFWLGGFARRFLGGGGGQGPKCPFLIAISAPATDAYVL